MATAARLDPRAVPVVRVDGHLPAVDPASLQSDALRRRTWPQSASDGPDQAAYSRAAAVLVPLVMHPEPTVLLTQRSEQLSSHAGQIAFPGGAVDAADASPVQAALREAQEEVGLDPRWVRVLGQLPVCLTSTGFRVTPVVALVDAAAAWRPNPSEVAEVFQVPLEYVMTPANHRWHRAEWAGTMREWLSMPYLDQGMERYIWGATAQMLRSLYDVLVRPDVPPH